MDICGLGNATHPQPHSFLYTHVWNAVTYACSQQQARAASEAHSCTGGSRRTARTVCTCSGRRGRLRHKRGGGWWWVKSQSRLWRTPAIEGIHLDIDGLDAETSMQENLYVALAASFNLLVPQNPTLPTGGFTGLIRQQSFDQLNSQICRRRELSVPLLVRCRRRIQALDRPGAAREHRVGPTALFFVGFTAQTSGRKREREGARVEREKGRERLRERKRLGSREGRGATRLGVAGRGTIVLHAEERRAAVLRDERRGGAPALLGAASHQ